MEGLSIMQFAVKDIEKNLSVLFGLDSPFNSIGQFRYLTTDLVKKKYREKAKNLHPDRSLIVGRNIQEMQEEFQSVNNAYQYLNEVLSQKNNILRFKPDAPKPFTGGIKKPSQKKDNNFHPHYSFFPDRKLRFAEFLYYKQKINWAQMIDALVWQSNNRPRLGEIGINWRYFSDDIIMQIINKKLYREKFGETALRLNIINSFQLCALLGKQKSFDKPIGKYFLEKNILTQIELVEFLHNFKKHNEKYF